LNNILQNLSGVVNNFCEFEMMSVDYLHDPHGESLTRKNPCQPPAPANGILYFHPLKSGLFIDNKLPLASANGFRVQKSLRALTQNLF